VLRRAVQRLCPRDLRELREDLVQSTMVKLLELQGRENSAAAPSSYLWRVAHSILVDELRRLERRRKMEGQLEGQRDPGSQGPEAFPSPGLKAAIEECMQGLAPDRRAAVALHLHGFGAAEAAAALCWDRKRVQNLTYRGLDDLRACLLAKGIKP
jgi:RNA polymerase sigma-70 factor (ECF subfamily)